MSTQKSVPRCLVKIHTATADCREASEVVLRDENLCALRASNLCKVLKEVWSSWFKRHSFALVVWCMDTDRNMEFPSVYESQWCMPRYAAKKVVSHTIGMGKIWEMDSWCSKCIPFKWKVRTHQRFCSSRKKPIRQKAMKVSLSNVLSGGGWKSRLPIRRLVVWLPMSKCPGARHWTPCCLSMRPSTCECVW